MAYLSPKATTTQNGVTSLSTNAEAVAGSVSTKALTPSNLSSVFAAPPAIGGTTPGTASFTTLTLSTALSGGNGGTGINNGAKTINLGSPTSGYVLTSDSGGNATWQVNAALGGVTSIAVTTNQINASANTGAVTLSLSSSIVTPGTLAVNGILRTSSSTTLNATGPYNLSIKGTQTSDTGSNFAQSAFILESVLSPAGNIAFIGGVAGITNLSKFIAASTKTIALASAYYGRPDATSNIGQLTKLATFYSDTFVSVAGTVPATYAFYGKDPNTGTVAQAAYFDNLAVGYDNVDLKGTHNAIFSNNVSIGSSSLTSLFNVGSSNQFQIDASGIVQGGTWQGGIIGLAYGGTAANLTASNGGIVYSTASAMAILGGVATASKMLLSGATAPPTWSTSTIPSSAGSTANKVLLSDGTNYVLSTLTFPNASATSGKVIISDGTNWIASDPTTSVVQFAKLGIGVAASNNQLSITGKASIGFGDTAAPTSGLIVSGVAAFGTSTPNTLPSGAGTASAGFTLVGDFALGASISDYRAMQIGGGNSYGYLYGQFGAVGEGIHFGYNYFADHAGTGHVINSGAATSRITAGYGSVTFALGATNTAPSQVAFLNSTGLLIGTSGAPSYTLDLTNAGVARMNSERTNAGAPGGSLTSHWLLCTTSDALRWGVGLVNPETGSNAGSDLCFFNYTDGGGFSLLPLFMKRSTGQIGINCTSVNNAASILQLGNFASTVNDLSLDGSAASEKLIIYYSVGTGKFTVGMPGSSTSYIISDFGSGNARFTIDSGGSVIVGSAAIATSATSGFLYIATGNGTPSGVPTSYTGRVPFYFDTSTNKLYIYNGAWKSVTLT